MRANTEHFRLDVIAEPAHGWRWQIFEGGRLVLQSEAIYATRSDASQAGIVEQSQLVQQFDGSWDSHTARELHVLSRRLG